MCKAKFQSDDLVDMISTTVRKMSKTNGDLRRQVLLTSVRKTLKSELGKKQRKLRRKYQVLVSEINSRHPKDVPETSLDGSQTSEETQEDLLGLDDFFSSLKRVNSKSDSSEQSRQS